MFAIGFFFASNAEAASLSLRASTDKVTVGSLVTINLYLDTQGKIINNAEANIQFSNDLIEVVSVKGSLFSLWVENPNFSNNSGQISFNGGIPDPGYKGSGAKVLTIIVKAKKAGTASLVFSGAAVRENDGLGTDILSGQSSASFIIASNEKEVTPPATVVTPEVKPEITTGSSVTISSAAYPDSNSWYQSKSATLNWKLPNNATAVQTLLDTNPNSTPTIKYSPAISSKSIGELSDGVWYFHVRYLVNNAWSKTSSFKIQIDSAAPSGLSVLPEKNNNLIIGLNLKGEDVLSGLSYFNLNIDNQPTIKVLAADAKNIIPWSSSEVGSHQVLVTVFDKAGNHSELTTQVNIDELATPVAEVLPEENNSNQIAENISTTSQESDLDFAAYYPFLFNLLKLLLLVILLFGWYKYIVIKERLKIIKKRADHLTLTLLLEKANKDLLVLEKAQKKKSLTRNEEKSLISLKKILSEIDKISLQKK